MVLRTGERTPAFRISFPCVVHMAVVPLKDGEQIVGLYIHPFAVARGGIGNWRRCFWGGRGWLRDNSFGTE